MAFQRFTDPVALSAFVRQHCPQFRAVRELQLCEISDGNINYVYRVNGGGHSVVVKQALPFIRVIGESWPLSQDRVRIEAAALRHAARYCPAHVPQLLHYDQQQCAIILEDIGNHRNLRSALIAGEVPPLLASHMACFMATTLFYSSDFYLDSHASKALVAQMLNPDLCSSTEAVFFVDPWCDHERNNVHRAVQGLARMMWRDESIRCEVARLKLIFQTQAQALIHGDLHTGSVFVTSKSTKVIDPEFGFVGPIGFDVGVLLGNYLLNLCARPSAQTTLLSLVEQSWNAFSQQFGSLLAQETRDPALKNPALHEHYLQQLLEDSLGFAGTEIIRRTIGIAQIAEWQMLSHESEGQAKARALRLGQQLILQRREMSCIEDLRALFPVA